MDNKEATLKGYILVMGLACACSIVLNVIPGLVASAGAVFLGIRVKKTGIIEHAGFWFWIFLLASNLAFAFNASELISLSLTVVLRLSVVALGCLFLAFLIGILFALYLVWRSVRPKCKFDLRQTVAVG